jgi:hypothetical protein
MPLKHLTLVLALVVTVTGCSTSTYFKLPENSKVSVYKRTEQFSSGPVKTTPFFWTSAGGIPYKLSADNGSVLQEGKLRAKFRVVSIFWPPFSLIYWPMGFRQACYDLTGPQPQDCSADLVQLRKQAAQ